MDEIPLATLSLALIVLLIVSGAFSLAETAMMAANRYRLKHQAQRGARGARLAVSLLAQTDKLLGVILLGNNLLNAACATLASVITVRLFGQGEWPLGIGAVVTWAGTVRSFAAIAPRPCSSEAAQRSVRSSRVAWTARIWRVIRPESTSPAVSPPPTARMASPTETSWSQ